MGTKICHAALHGIRVLTVELLERVWFFRSAPLTPHLLSAAGLWWSIGTRPDEARFVDEQRIWLIVWFFFFYCKLNMPDSFVLPFRS